MPAGSSGQVETLKFVQHSSGLQSCETSWSTLRPQQTGLANISGLPPSGCSTMGIKFGQGALSAALRASGASGLPPTGELPSIPAFALHATTCLQPAAEVALPGGTAEPRDLLTKVLP